MFCRQKASKLRDFNEDAGASARGMGAPAALEPAPPTLSFCPSVRLHVRRCGAARKGAWRGREWVVQGKNE